jgi:hypothetical protein
MATKFECALQTSNSYYSDWAALYLAPKVATTKTTTTTTTRKHNGWCFEAFLKP